MGFEGCLNRTGSGKRNGSDFRWSGLVDQARPPFWRLQFLRKPARGFSKLDFEFSECRLIKGTRRNVLDSKSGSRIE
jgi:hypothetical protein